ncbi:hypothetical protein BpHYR1_048283 [Brachionus plicatilis]|uniref:Uncharacterized protein n=1 Tax=Brachionus plicatilis TaxID=10195 RepID=A0A3M7QC86_BRAPC|nr:hypothetical protein BpHYR1_048283 [Brachionus plicatilis]
MLVPRNNTFISVHFLIFDTIKKTHLVVRFSIKSWEKSIFIYCLDFKNIDVCVGRSVNLIIDKIQMMENYK